MNWPRIAEEVTSLISSEPDEIANYANVSAHLFAILNADATAPPVNWLGFYRVVADETLLLGPFQGKVACLRIPLGAGVCGTAAASQSTLVVPDVHAFPGHIACDSASQSEVVIPVFGADGKMAAILDVDSSRKQFFNDEIVQGLEQCMLAFKRPTPPLPPKRQIKHASNANH